MPAAFSDLLFINPMDTPKIAQNASEYDEAAMRKIWKQRLYRCQVQMMTACSYYAGGFIWGSKNNKDYTPELLRVKEMILNYVKVNA